MKNWYKFNGIFYNTLFDFLIPQRKIGDTFKYKGKKYIVVKSYKEKLGCDNCAFRANCNCISILKRGHCAYFNRKDKISVSFVGDRINI